MTLSRQFIATIGTFVFNNNIPNFVLLEIRAERHQKSICVTVFTNNITLQTRNFTIFEQSVISVSSSVIISSYKELGEFWNEL